MSIIYNYSGKENEEKHIGMVVGEDEENGYHDSYFYGFYWNPELEKVERIQTGSTAYASGHGCKIDANEEIFEKAYAYNERAWSAYHLNLLEETKSDIKGNYNGKVVIVRGKKNKGETGYVTRIMNNQWGGIKIKLDSGEEVWNYERNVEKNVSKEDMIEESANYGKNFRKEFSNKILGFFERVD